MEPVVALVVLVDGLCLAIHDRVANTWVLPGSAGDVEKAINAVRELTGLEVELVTALGTISGVACQSNTNPQWFIAVKVAGHLRLDLRFDDAVLLHSRDAEWLLTYDADRAAVKRSFEQWIDRPTLLDADK